jgi:hypothetical protein
LPVRHLKIKKAKYFHDENDQLSEKPHIDVFDPRSEDHRYHMRDEEKREFGLKLQEVFILLKHINLYKEILAFPNT